MEASATKVSCQLCHVVLSQMGGRQFEFDVARDSTVHDLKKRAAELAQTWPELVKLIVDAAALEDEDDLAAHCPPDNPIFNAFMVVSLPFDRLRKADATGKMELLELLDRIGLPPTGDTVAALLECLKDVNDMVKLWAIRSLRGLATQRHGGNEDFQYEEILQGLCAMSDDERRQDSSVLRARASLITFLTEKGILG